MIAFGTCSWTLPGLIASKKFFPPRCKTGTEQLGFYAEQWPCVEVDSSNYSMPTQQRIESWRAVVPKNFVFHVKAFGLWTFKTCGFDALPFEARAILTEKYGLGDFVHRRVALDQLPPEVQSMLWARFKSALEPLWASSQLGSVVFQFPDAFAPNEENTSYVKFCCKQIHPYAMVAEFRNRLWYAPDHRVATMDLCRAENIALSATDDDAVDDIDGAGPPDVAVATRDDFAYARIHRRAGSNRLLSEGELQRWKEKCLRMRAGLKDPKTGRVFILVSTDHEDQTVLNMDALSKLLGKDVVVPWSQTRTSAPKSKGQSTLKAFFKPQRSSPTKPSHDEMSHGGSTLAGASVGAPPPKKSNSPPTPKGL